MENLDQTVGDPEPPGPKCDHCGLHIPDPDDIIQDDIYIYCSRACANAQQ